MNATEIITRFFEQNRPMALHMVNLPLPKVSSMDPWTRMRIMALEGIGRLRLLARRPATIPFDRVEVCTVCGLWPRAKDTDCPDCGARSTMTMARDQLAPVVCCAKLTPYNPTV